MTRGIADRRLVIVGDGAELHRALAVACAQAGVAAIGLATISPTRDQEYAVNSIGNEVWALGIEQHVDLVETAEAEAIAGLIERTAERYGSCDAVVVLGPVARGVAPQVRPGTIAGCRALAAGAIEFAGDFEPSGGAEPLHEQVDSAVQQILDALA